MFRALTSAATGLKAQETKIENISSDLANINTDGYKRNSTEFHELMYETIQEPGAQLGEGTRSPVGVQVGMGVKVGAAGKVHEQGPARMTYRDLDLMIEGRGYFPVTRPNGEVAYTRRGAFRMDNQGRVMLSGGATLNPVIQVPVNTNKLSIAPNGLVTAHLANGEEAELGNIQLASFVNEEGLSSLGEGLFRATQGSGPPSLSPAGENGVGLLQSGALEGSNVNVANSMVEMITTQRGYQMGTKVLESVDKMLGDITGVVGR